MKNLVNQVALQRDEFEHQKQALGDQITMQREELEQQAKRAEELRDATQRTLVESVRTRYDASAPRVAVRLERLCIRCCQKVSGGPKLRVSRRPYRSGEHPSAANGVEVPQIVPCEDQTCGSAASRAHQRLSTSAPRRAFVGDVIFLMR